VSLNPAFLYYGDVVQVVVVALSVVLAIVSMNAYRKRPEGRYLLLMLAFLSMCTISVGTTLIQVWVGGAATVLPFVELYLIPAMQLLMIVSFLVAISWSQRARKRLLATFLAATVIIGLGVSGAYLYGPTSGSVVPGLPAGCVRPQGGYLIIASSLGYNDSAAHGAPAKNWPVLFVSSGTQVVITVCNLYEQPVGFQVAHYLEASTETVSPGHVITVRFLADLTGSFLIYCTTFSPIHVYLQGGEVNVV